MILKLLQNDVDKRVDYNGFLNSEIIKKKINEFINNPCSHYEGSQLEKNKNYKNEDDILFGTINFKNFEDLKNRLPKLKNYENNNKIYKINKLIIILNLVIIISIIITIIIILMLIL